MERYRERRRRAQDSDDKETLDALDLFRKDVASFLRLYDFLSQIVNYGDTDLEKRSVFFTHLLPWLAPENQNQAIDLSGVQLTHYRLDALDERRLTLGDQEAPLKPITGVGGGEAREPETAYLSTLIERLNQLFEGELSDADLLGYAHHIKGKLLESETLAQQAARNSKEQFALGDFQQVLMDNVIEGIDRYQAMAGQVMGNPRVQKAFGEIMLDLVYREFERQRAAPPQTGA